MRCQHPDGCLFMAEGLYRLFPTGTQRALCAPCERRLSAMGLHFTRVESGWLARAIDRDLPTKVLSA